MKAPELAELCWNAYDIITGSPLEDRYHEGEFPHEIILLMGRFEIDYEDFQENWNDYAG